MSLKLPGGGTGSISLGPESAPSKLDWTPVTGNLSVSFWWRFSGTPGDWTTYRFLTELTDALGNKIIGIITHATGSTFYFEIGVYDSAYTKIGYFISNFSLSADTWYHIVLVSTSATNNKI